MKAAQEILAKLKKLIAEVEEELGLIKEEAPAQPAVDATAAGPVASVDAPAQPEPQAEAPTEPAPAAAQVEPAAQ